MQHQALRGRTDSETETMWVRVGIGRSADYGLYPNKSDDERPSMLEIYAP